MHEVAVAQGIVEACCERAAGARVLCVTLEIGTLTCVLPESLRFCFGIATEGTRLAGSELEIIRLPGRSRCRDCGGEVRMDNVFSVCTCGSTNLERPEGGEELRIKSMRIEEAA
ncbi:MAG: hydrogenase maturation nickel metallochaperone HypA [Rhodanobacteraceae bacterium]